MDKEPSKRRKWYKKHSPLIKKISVTTVLKRILRIAKNIHKPLFAIGKLYEADEMRTFYKSKTRLLWIVYALRNDTKQIADFALGTRTIKTLKRVTDRKQQS